MVSVRVDAAIVLAVTVLTATLLLTLYVRQARSYTLAAECYVKALATAQSAASNLSSGLAVKPPQSWVILIYYPNGSVQSFGSVSRARCYAYTVAAVKGEAVLVEARG